jgi:hypothetical protein
MLEHYFNKINLDITSSSHGLGSIIDAYISEFPKLDQAKVALIGYGEDCNSIREHLYRLSKFNNTANNIVDLGNIKTHDEEHENQSALYLIIEELKNLGITSVFIGKELNQGFALYRGVKGSKNQMQVSCISSKIPVSENQLFSKIHEDDYENTCKINSLAYQNHFVSPEELATIKSKNHSIIRLGNLKKNIEESELYMRNSNLILLDINVIQHADAPAKEGVYPSGLSSEEACQIAKYAGISDYNSCFGIFGYVQRLDERELTAALCAQIIWYFIDGFYSRMNDKHESHQDFIKYRCDFSYNDTPILFIKSKRSSRWWMKIEHPAEPNNANLTLTIPCSYEDYQIAADGETPERYLNALQSLK